MKKERFNDILNIIKESHEISAQEILLKLSAPISKVTLLRDLEILINRGLIGRRGAAKSTKYFLTSKGSILRTYEIDKYFASENRSISFHNFNYDIFQNLENLFSENEIKEIENQNLKFQKNFSTFPENVIKKELERLTVEFSWKSSHLEGNTYTLLDTERLLKYQTAAPGHPNEEAVMIINHKNAMNFIYQNSDFYKTITVSKIEKIHDIIVNDLNISKGIRHTPVGIIGTDYKPLSTDHQLKEVLEKTCEIINSTKFPLEKALIAVAMISYIQPFEDGDKRTSRLIGNAILLAHSFSPLSYKSVDEIAYKAALIIFYEQNSIGNFKELFVSQFINALEKYF